MAEQSAEGSLELNQRAAAARAGAGGTTEAVIACENLTVFNLGRIDVPQMHAIAVIAPLHLEHLVEIAIEDFALPAHVDRVPAHQAFDGRRIERVVEQRHVIAQEVIVLQIGREPRDGQIRDRVEFVEDDAEMFVQFALVICFQFFLRSGQECAVGIVNQMERQPRVMLSSKTPSPRWAFTFSAE